MSQIKFQSHTREGAEVEVVTGWDRPLQYVHLTVYDPQGEVWFSELDSPSPFTMTPESAVAKLTELGIPYHTTLRLLLEEHQAGNIGNSLLTMPPIRHKSSPMTDDELRSVSSSASIAADRMSYIAEALERIAEGAIPAQDTDSVMVSVGEAWNEIQGHLGCIRDTFREWSGDPAV